MSLKCPLIVLLAFLAMPLATAQNKPSKYATLLAQLKSGKTDIDYARLRLSYVDSPEQKNAKDTSDAEKAMTLALRNKDYPKAIAEADKVLAGEYVNLDAHFVEFVASQESANREQAEFHRTIFRGLLDSIRNSGDGKSTKTAWVIISVHEEYVLLRVLGYQPSQQSLSSENGHFYDVMKVKKADDGTEQTFYFNTDIPMKHSGL
jgi:hypothetical protein